MVWFIVILMMAFLTFHCINQEIPTAIFSQSVTGKFIGFQYGDYPHVVIKTIQGDILSFFSRSEECFLALNKNDYLVIKFIEKQTYFPEGDGYYPARYIQSVSTLQGEKQWIYGSSKNKKYTNDEIETCNMLRKDFIFMMPTD